MAVEQTESIAQTCPACGASIDAGTAEPLETIACSACGEMVRAERKFDNFVIIDVVGVGGMGTVYKARDTLLDRFVALKLLRKDLEGGLDATAELRQEARAAASVNHPNIVQVFSSGTAHGQFYLVMELVEHGSLDDLIEQRKRVPEEQILEIGIQAAKGLRAAHAKGLIHRDVKPANILFADDHLAKIGDFGLAGITAEARGEIWGTPFYVAPERLSHQAEDFRSDIYSLGATLFHAVAGIAPIEGQTNSASELLALKQQPALLSVIAPDISPETARVLQRMIAPEPAQRFASYDDLVAELEAAYKKLTGRDMIDVATAKRKTRRIIAAAAAILLVVAIGVFAYVRKTEQKIAVSSNSIPLAELEKQAADARRQLVLNHYNVAGSAFARIEAEARGRQPFEDWARLQRGLAAMIGRDTVQAGQAFQAVEKAGARGFAREDSELADFFGDTAKRLLAVSPVAAADVATRTQPFNAFALLLFGLKDIDQLDVQNAAALLDQFIKSNPAGKFAWIAELKPIGQKYLDDCRVYLAWKADPAKAAAPADLKKQLKTKSAISESISGQRRPGAIQAPPPSQPMRSPTQSEIAAGAEKRKMWLAAWKNKLIADLNRNQFSGSFTDATGAEYTGIAGADDQSLALKLPYGVARVPWTRVPASALLMASSSFIRPNSNDAADRQWLCAVYASATNQPEAARQLAEAAASSKPEYRDQIPLLLSQ